MKSSQKLFSSFWNNKGVKGTRNKIIDAFQNGIKNKVSKEAIKDNIYARNNTPSHSYIREREEKIIDKKLPKLTKQELVKHKILDGHKWKYTNDEWVGDYYERHKKCTICGDIEIERKKTSITSTSGYYTLPFGGGGGGQPLTCSGISGYGSVTYSGSC